MPLGNAKTGRNALQKGATNHMEGQICRDLCTSKGDPKASQRKCVGHQGHWTSPRNAEREAAKLAARRFYKRVRSGRVRRVDN